MKISIVLVSHNHLPYLKGCVRRIIAHTSEYELIIIDNGSSDDTTAFIRDLEDSGVTRHVVFNSENTGYAAGCNQGIRLSTCPLIAFPHSDCFVTSGWSDRVVEHFEIQQDAFRIGVVIPVTNYANESFPIYDRELQRSFVEYKPSNKSHPTEDDIEMILGHTYSPDGLDVFASSIKWRTPLVYSVDISSFCTVFSSAVFDECGMFDELYSCRGYEDKDLYMRMQRHGFDAWLAQNCFVHHFGNVTSDGEGFCFPELMDENKGRFERVWTAQ